MYEEQQMACRQQRQENVSNLALARQIFTADKTYHGSVHKKERDQTWEQKRQNDTLRVQKNRKLSRGIKKGVEQQKYLTNVQRVEDIMRSSQERYQTEVESL